jgi:hypothetical protein
MSRRAASMAAMANRSTNPQEIQAIQKSLVDGVQNGSIQPYVGIPLIQELTQRLTEAKTQMAQSMAGAGMQQGQQGVPIAQQVMQQAAQADQSQGLEALPSNLPQEYAGGGIIAFEGGGEVKRYRNEGYVYQDPFGVPDYEVDRNSFKRDVRVGERYDPSLQGAIFGYNVLPPVDTVKPTATPAAETKYDPTTATRRSVYSEQNAPSAVSKIPGAGSNFKMPTLPTMKETAAPTLTNYDTLIGDMPKKTKEASEAAVTKTQKIYEDMDKPGFDIREEKLGKREAGLEKDTAIGRALNLMSLGFGIAGSKERTVAGALGNEGRQGIADLIRGEAANRAAKDRLDDARDNFEQQKVAAKKGNYQAAETAGNRAADDLRAGTQLTMTGAHYGNTEALNRFQTTQQGDFQRASLGQAGILGLRELDVKERQLAQHGAIANAQLAAQEKRFAALDKQSQARLLTVRNNALNTFVKDIAPQLNTQFVKEYGPNWRTAQDKRSLEAQMIFNQQRDAHLANALNLHDERMSYGRSADELLQSGQ